MVNGPNTSRQEFEDLIINADVLDASVLHSIDIVVNNLRSTSQLTRKSIESVLGPDLAAHIFQRSKEVDAHKTNRALAGAIATKKASFTEVLSLNPGLSSTSIHRSISSVPVGQIIAEPASKQTRDSVMIHNFLATSLTKYHAQVERASDWLTSDNDYVRIPQLQELAMALNNFDESRLTTIGDVKQEKDFIPGGAKNATEFEKKYQQIVDLKDDLRKVKLNVRIKENEVEQKTQEITSKDEEIKQLTTLLLSASGASIATIQPLITTARSDLATLRTELRRLKQDLDTLTAADAVTTLQGQIQAVATEIDQLKTEHAALSESKKKITDLCATLGLPFKDKTDLLKQNVSLEINTANEAQSLENWIRSGRLQQFADRIASMSTKSSRGRVSSQQFLRETVIYHLFGEYKSLSPSEMQELDEMMKTVSYVKTSQQNGFQSPPPLPNQPIASVVSTPAGATDPSKKVTFRKKIGGAFTYLKKNWW